MCAGGGGLYIGHRGGGDLFTLTAGGGGGELYGNAGGESWANDATFRW